MEYKELQQQLEALTSLGYNREQIIKIAETAPSIFKYTPNDIKLILSSIKISKDELENIANNTYLISDDDKKKRRR